MKDNKRAEIYRVAEHYFKLVMESQNPLWSELQAFEPFVVDQIEAGAESIFELRVVDRIDRNVLEQLIESNPNRNDGMVDIDISRCDGGYLLRLQQPFSEEVNATLFIPKSGGSRVSEVALRGEAAHQLQALNNAMILNYLVAGAERKTILLHSSTVILEGRSYLFLGKSGTGKSTHSRMWLEAFSSEGATLLNDDHPIVRILDSGEVRTYGSPWSGKTPCYKNLSAPLDGIIRIEQAPLNEAIALRPSAAYASIITSTSGLQWIPSIADLKAETVGEIVSKVPSLRMRCLPNREAAICCKEALDSLKM